MLMVLIGRAKNQEDAPGQQGACAHGGMHSTSSVTFIVHVLWRIYRGMHPQGWLLACLFDAYSRPNRKGTCHADLEQMSTAWMAALESNAGKYNISYRRSRVV